MFRMFQKSDHSKGWVVDRKKVLKKLDYNPNYIRDTLARLNEDPTVGCEQIPCGYCWACKLNYSAEWATRLTLETQKSDHNYFITLTYDDMHVPIWESIKWDGTLYKNDGTWRGSLDPDDMTRFIKTLRKHFERLGIKGIKYFYAGEYGETTHRPHYHMILMHCPLDINEFYDTHVDKNFKAHWKSHELEKWWPHGMIDIAEVEWSSAAYVARYCMKKLSTSPDKSIYYKQGKLPEFIRMSKGIGMDYYKMHREEIYANDEMIMKTVKGNTGAFKPPKAFDRKFKEHDPEGFELIRQSRQMAAERARELKQSITDYTDKKILEMEREKILTKAKMLPRSAIE